MISENEQGENFWEEMSKLISIIMIQDQQVKNIQELLETGNKAIQSNTVILPKIRNYHPIHD